MLGISDLKPKKVDSKTTIGTNKSDVIVETANNKKEIGDIHTGERITISPINTTIKVNNCEIVNRRPRSVTAAIFSLPSFSPKTELKPQKVSSNVVTTSPAVTVGAPAISGQKTRVQSSTAKIFRPNPQNVTSSIFAPRTKDMNKGFLMFSEDETGLTSKLRLCCEWNWIWLLPYPRILTFLYYNWQTSRIVRWVEKEKQFYVVGAGVKCTRLFTHQKRASLLIISPS